MGGETRFPFDASNLTINEYNGMLYIATGHEGYIDTSLGQGHQGLLMIAVDEATMTGKIVCGDFGHSFTQYLSCDDSGIYLLEESEGSRCATLKKFNTTAFAENWDPYYDYYDIMESYQSVFDYAGERTSAWAIPTNATVNGLALSDDNVLTIGTSIDQSIYGESNIYALSTNLYLTVTPKSVMTRENTTLVEEHGNWSVTSRPSHNKAFEATSVKWITNYTGDNEDAHNIYNAKITKINNDRFLLTWAQSDETHWPVPDIQDALSGDTLHYLFINGNGDIISEEFTADATISDCQPIVHGSDVIFYSCCGIMFDFYIINGNSGHFSKKMIRIAGENATWDLGTNGKLTISGSGMATTDAISFGIWDLQALSGGFWQPISEHVSSMIFAPGITGIGDSEFLYFEELTDISFPDTLTSIGEFAFDGYDLAKIDNFTISGYTGTAAEKYANENGFKFIALDDISNPSTTVPTEQTEPTEPTVPTEPYDTPNSNPGDPTNPTEPSKPTNPTDPDNPSTPSLGDVDGNGEINVNDVTDIQKYIVKLKPFTDEQKSLADTDKNGKIDINDVTLLQKVIVKIAVI